MAVAAPTPAFGNRGKDAAVGELGRKSEKKRGYKIRRASLWRSFLQIYQNLLTSAVPGQPLTLVENGPLAWTL
jgi:hypothetical protein